MTLALTIENLDEAVAEELRLRAARHGHSVEAEARDILVQGIHSREPLAHQNSDLPAPSRPGSSFDHLIGSWVGRGTTDELMKDLCSEE